MHKVAILVLDHVVAMDLGTAVQVFGAAGCYEVQVCSPGGKPVRAEGGFRIAPEHGLEALSTADTVVVPGIHGGSPFFEGTLDSGVCSALRDAAQHARMVSICTGAFVLAAAGLLDGRPATTHWRHADRFREHFPDVLLDPAVLFVDDGDVLTSAGVTAGVDLCLHIVRRDHGSLLANRVAKRCVAAAWREGGQAQFIERRIPDSRDTTTASTRDWALQRLDEPLGLSTLAEHARMSVRTFTRRFRSETGLSPTQWLIAQRVERARQLLEATDLPVDRIATDAGFGTATAMRQHLRQTVGASPTAYRRVWQSV